MKAKSSGPLWAACALALVAVLGTLAWCLLAWLRYPVLWGQPQPLGLPFPTLLLRLASERPAFMAAVYWLLACNVLSGLGSAWLALAHRR